MRRADTDMALADIVTAARKVLAEAAAVAVVASPRNTSPLGLHSSRLAVDIRELSGTEGF